MDNLKVKVNSVEESKEVQELFFDLGYSQMSGETKPHLNKDIVMVRATNCGDIHFISTTATANYEQYLSQEDGYQELTLPKLHDMVVLKRNSIDDATHKNSSNQMGYLASDGVEYFWNYHISKWDLCSELTFKSERLKPIQNNDLPFIDSEEDMREFLEKQEDGSYKLITASVNGCVDRDWIEVPEGADTLAGNKRGDNTRYFWNHKNKTIIGTGESLERYRKWEDIKSTAKQWLSEIDDDNFGILWQRNPQVESLNDKVASAEEARQKQPNKKTIDVMDGVKLMESLARFNNTDRGADFDNFELFEKHSHYKKDVSHLEFIDVYRVLDLFEVESHAVGHAVKKLLCSGQRGVKGKAQDIQEAIDSLNRELEIMRENESSKD